jgi:hypothetical protein
LFRYWSSKLPRGLIRIPGRIQVDGQVDGDATDGTALPLTSESNGSSTRHFAFIRQIVQTPNSCMLEVYPVLSFSSSGGALACYNEMDDAAKATLLPLPALSLLRHRTPEAFGAPLNFGNWSNLQRFMTYYHSEAVHYTYVEAGEPFVLSLAVFLTVIESTL